MNGPADVPVIDASVTYLRRNWDRVMTLPNVLEIDACNRNASAPAPRVSGWLQAGAEKGFDAFSVDFKTDCLPEGTFCCPGGFDFDYSALVGKYGRYESVRKHTGLSGLAAMEKEEGGAAEAVLVLWDITCAGHDGTAVVIRPKRMYPVSGTAGAAGGCTRFAEPYDWKPERWYRMHVLCGDFSGTANTVLEQWICDLGTGSWTLLCRADLGAPGIRFRNNLAVYLENTLVQRAGDVRTLECKSIYIHEHGGSWRQLSEAGFSRDRDDPGSYSYGADGAVFYAVTTGVRGGPGSRPEGRCVKVRQDSPAGHPPEGGTGGSGTGSGGSFKEKKKPSCLTVILVIAGLILLARWLFSPSGETKTVSAAATARPTATARLKSGQSFTRRPTDRPRSAGTYKPPVVRTAAPAPMKTYDWELFSELGSAYSLSGRNIIVSVYLSDTEYGWRWDVNGAKDNATAHKNLKHLGIACGWLTKQAKRYGSDPGFFYDWTKHPDLFYEMKLAYRAIKPYDAITGTFTQTAYQDMSSFIYNNIDCAGLLSRYGAGNIVFLFFVNNPAGQEMRSHSINVKKGYAMPAYPYEFCVLYNHQNDYELFPATIAHEMLHCYGAHDLYVSNSDAISAEYAEYLSKRQSNDIMCNTYDPISGRAYYDHIAQTLTDVDAYYVGIAGRSGDVLKWSLGPSDFDK